MAIKRRVFIHPSSFVDKPVDIGAGTEIWHFCHISKRASIGKNCKIGQNVFIGENVAIGNNVKLQNNVSIYEGVEIEDDVFIGPSAVFTNVLKPRSQFPVSRHYLRTIVKKGATIGANATIVCGHTIGAYAFIGAGSVVTKNVDDYRLTFGNPSRYHGYVCECGIKLPVNRPEAYCLKCGSKFKKIRGLLLRDG